MKQTITIIIIVVALGGAGYFGYKFLISNSSSSAATSSAGTSQILPFGDNLQFNSVEKYNKDGKVFPYPVVNPAEIGPDVGSLVK